MRRRQLSLTTSDFHKLYRLDAMVKPLEGTMEGETPSVYTETYPKARKEHKCYECGRAIPVGGKYHNFKGCWDGKWDEFKTCGHCNDLRHEIAKDDSDGAMPPFGNLAEWAFEGGYDFPPVAEVVRP